jgi:hypothetical protein
MQVKASKKMAWHVTDQRKSAAQAANYFWNYNAVEAVMLFCACIVLITGLMFSSDGVQEGSAARKTLTYFVMFIVISSIIYFSCVLTTELVIGLGLWKPKEAHFVLVALVYGTQGLFRYGKDAWHFDHYEPSDFESLWLENIKTWKKDVCEHLMKHKQQTRVWLGEIEQVQQRVKELQLHGAAGYDDPCGSSDPPNLFVFGHLLGIGAFSIAAYKYSFQGRTWPGPFITCCYVLFMGFMVLTADQLCPALGRPWPRQTGARSVYHRYVAGLCLSIAMDSYMIRSGIAKTVRLPSVIKHYLRHVAKAIIVLSICSALTQISAWYLAQVNAAALPPPEACPKSHPFTYAGDGVVGGYCCQVTVNTTPSIRKAYTCRRLLSHLSRQVVLRRSLHASAHRANRHGVRQGYPALSLGVVILKMS